eukprot:CAMPEP_0174249926 /NCGR_PEP_ID=MMETSP0439-20130205/251_1 /TAXON_ID=0 /ORGANISM="Stereomyxa ramosa, Strain Chinc5" /LENGTH=307 /DNA_ID=CAMNT_0015329871 /DNA_START=82 /DNA_END=1002 /DNA_ORIENTATION=-
MSECPENAFTLFGDNNLLATAAHTCFYEHYPFVLTPDVVWITIIQGFAHHVNLNCDKLRSMFVDYDGKEKIVVTRREFVKGSPNNDWVGVFPDFTKALAEHIGPEKVELVEAEFSTTTQVSKVVSQIVLMDAMQCYSSYVVRGGCGFPSITLRGTVNDWESIRERTKALGKFDLEWWTDGLVKVLEEFVEAAKGNANTKFWRSMVNKHQGSGYKEPMTGWIQAFFPYYLQAGTLVRNTFVMEYESYMDVDEDQVLFAYNSNSLGVGLKLERTPTSISMAPFVYEDVSGPVVVTYPMAFMGGLVALVQ